MIYMVGALWLWIPKALLVFFFVDCLGFLEQDSVGDENGVQGNQGREEGCIRQENM
jgi:hypothetical protein